MAVGTASEEQSVGADALVEVCAVFGVSPRRPEPEQAAREGRTGPAVRGGEGTGTVTTDVSKIDARVLKKAAAKAEQDLK